MPTIFDQQFSRSGFPGLLGDFGEPVVYLPAAGGRRSVTAIVERDPRAIFDISGNAVMPKITIRVANAKCGIESKTVNIGSDQIELPENIGDTTLRRFSLMQLMSEDSGVTHLALL